MNSPVRLGVFSCSFTPTGFYRGFEAFPVLEPWAVRSLSLPSCSFQFICLQKSDDLVLQLLPCCASSPPQLPVSAPPTSLNECFSFNSLVVRLPYSSIFWQFWYFLFLNLLSFWLCEKAKCTYLPVPPSWLEVCIIF